MASSVVEPLYGYSCESFVQVGFDRCPRRAICRFGDDDAPDARAAFPGDNPGDVAAGKFRRCQRKSWPEAVQFQQPGYVVRILLRAVKLRLARFVLQKRQ